MPGQVRLDGHGKVVGLEVSPRLGELGNRWKLRLGPPLATVRLRVLDAAGRPLANTRLHGELWHDPDSVPGPASGPARPSWFVLTTDSNGVATFHQNPGRGEVVPRLDVTRRSRDKDTANDEHWSIGSVRLPITLAEGEMVDLGDVLLAPVPVISAGIVCKSPLTA